MNMIKIEIKNRFTGSVIFTYEKEKATIKDAVIKAVKSGAYLSRADLSGGDLSGANLSGAYLSGVNLSRADLSGVNLSGAYLSGADLSRADLSGVNLSGVNLPIFCKWRTSIVDNKIKIGCKIRSIEEWDLFFASNEVIETERNTPKFKQIEAVYLSYKAYLTHLL